MPDLHITTENDQTSMSWQDALKRLKDGNDRFVNNKSLPRNLQHGMKQTAGGQYPFAVLLSCMDSRTPSEIIFDQGLGDIFNIRIAGNFVNTDVLGSMEFACKLAGSKLIAVIGHTDCGAIRGACDHVELGNLTSIINQIQPAVEAQKDFPGTHSSKNQDFVAAVARQNVLIALQDIQDRSPILKEMIDSGNVGLVGGMYDLNTGKVVFY